MVIPQGESKHTKEGLQTEAPIVPDAPIGHFHLTLFGGKRGYLANTRDLCRHRVLTTHRIRRPERQEADPEGCGEDRLRRQSETAQRERERIALRSAQAWQTTLWRGACLSALVLSFAAILISAPPASAARTYDSQTTGFKEPVGVTIDTGNHVWVSDPGKHGLISEYSAYPSQELLATRTGNGKFSRHGASVTRLAVNAANDHLYVADSTHVDNFNASGYFVSPEWHLCPFGECGASVATDNSEGSSRGRVYAAVALSDEPYADGYVAAFDPNHNEVPFGASESYISGNRIMGTPEGGPFTYNFANDGGPRSLVVDASGDIFVADSGTNEVYEFESSGEFVHAFTGAEIPGGFGEVLGVAVDPTNETVLVVDRIRGVVDEFSSSGAYLGQITGTGPSQSTPFGELRGGIAVNSDGYVYLADSFHGVVDIFSPKAILPKATYGPKVNPTATSEVLKATVNPNGGAPVTECRFESEPIVITVLAH